MRLKVLHVINSLAIGGAETLLINSLSKNGLQLHTDNILIYFKGTSILEKKIDAGVKIICLNYNGITDLPRVLKKIKKIIAENKVDIVHSHLNPAGFYTSLALPKNLKQVHTLHTMYSADTETRRVLLKLEKKILFKKKNVSLIFLSEILKDDFLEHIHFKGKTYILENFIEDAFFSPKPKKQNPFFKIVAVGNLKPQKNYQYLFEIFKHLKNIPADLEVYGYGDIEKYQSIIAKEGLNIKLMGQHTNIHEVLPQYDLFIMPSKFEGFPLSVIEAMASGVPCMLSDIKPLKNIAAGNAIYFTLDNPEIPASIIKSIVNKEINIDEMAKKAKIFAEKFRRKFYIEKLLHIYNDIMND